VFSLLVAKTMEYFLDYFRLLKLG